MFYIGIDIGKSNHEASIVNSNGEQLGKSMKFPNSHSGALKLVNFIHQYANDINDVIIGMEATGHYWLSLFSFLKSNNYYITVINPIQSDSFRNFYVRKTKNDSKDSFIIAQVIRFGQFKETLLADELLISLKNLTRYRFELVDMISDLKRKVITILDQVFPEYEKLFSDIFGKTSKQLLLELTTPEAFLNIDTEKLVTILKQHSRGTLGLDKALKIKDMASNSFGIKFSLDALSFEIRSMVDIIIHNEKQLEELNNYIKSIYNELDCHLHTISGIGEILAASILSEIGDIKRFNNGSQLVAFAGIDPTVKQSGQFNSNQNKMSKRGSPYLRRAIYLAAFNGIVKDPQISKYYQKKRNEGKKYGVAIGACMRKMTHIIYAVLRDNQDYHIS